MNDEIIKALAFNKSVRIYAVSNTNTLNEIGKRLHYYPSALDAMGRVLSMGAMMGQLVKLLLIVMHMGILEVIVIIPIAILNIMILD
mgnify:CR=1 FL=1